MSLRANDEVIKRPYLLNDSLSLHEGFLSTSMIPRKLRFDKTQRRARARRSAACNKKYVALQNIFLIAIANATARTSCSHYNQKQLADTTLMRPRTGVPTLPVLFQHLQRASRYNEELCRKPKSEVSENGGRSNDRTATAENTQNCACH